MVFAQSFFLSVRANGIVKTLRLIWTRIFGSYELYVFVRPLKPSGPLEMPLETNGISIRRMHERDADDVARLLPFELNRFPLVQRRQRILDRLGDGIVATRSGRIVGAAWFLEDVAPTKRWYEIVKQHVVLPARMTTNLFVVSGEKNAGFAISKCAGDWLAAAGVRTIVSQIRADNKPSIIVARLLGGRLVARQVEHFWFGRRRTEVVSVENEAVFGPMNQLAHSLRVQRSSVKDA